MTPSRDQIQQDVMTHFALGTATSGSVFDLKGFWRLTIPRYLLRDLDFEGAMLGLVAIGYVEAGSRGYQLTLKGEAHLKDLMPAQEYRERLTCDTF